MRALWPIERAALEATAEEYSAVGQIIRQQTEHARVTRFKNTGSGFFSDLSVVGEVPLLPDKSPLDGAHGHVEGLAPATMGFMIFVKEGRLNLLEAYVLGDRSTDLIDFEHASHEVKPWRRAGL